MRTFMRTSALIAVALLIGAALGWYGRGALAPGPTPPAVAVAPADASARAGSLAQPPAALMRLEQLLLARDFDAVVAHFEALEEARDPAAPAVRERLLAWARHGSSRLERIDAESLLAAYTWLYIRDAEAHGVHADLLLQLGRRWDAVQALHRQMEAAGAGALAERARQRIAAVLEEMAAALLARGDRAGVLALYRDALALDPLNHRYRYLLGVWLADSGDPAAALEALDGIPDGAVDAGELDALRSRLLADAELAARFGEGLPLERRGEHLTVQLTLAGGAPLRLIVDTGATVTVLKPSALARARMSTPLGRTIRLGTAGGVVEAPLFRVPGLSLGPYMLTDVQVAMIRLEELDGVDGLLGLDALADFSYQIDPDARLLRLSRR